MNNEELNFTVINNEGIEVKCDVVSMITGEDNKIYLLYTDYLLDSKGNFRLLASEVVQKKNEYMLQDIEDKEKFNELVKAAKNLQKKVLGA